MSFGYQVLGFGSGGVAAAFIVACGGTESTCGDYKIHTFTGDGTFTVSEVGNAAGSDSADYLVVAGGAGSGDYHGAGGGAGGYRESCGCGYTSSPLGACVSAEPVSVQGYPISVGGGGSGGVRDGPNNGGSGGNSIFSTITSAGGGGGGGNHPGGQPGNAGGSGGGGGGSGSPRCGGAGNTPPVSPAQGFPGQTSIPNTAAAGGGATEAGGLPVSPFTTIGGDGAGTEINPSTCVGTPSTNAPPGPAGPLRYFGGGGGGSEATIYGKGGVGGGGSGPWGHAGGPPSCGQTNTGGGGGNEGHPGGSGVVIIRYKYQ